MRAGKLIIVVLGPALLMGAACTKSEEPRAQAVRNLGGLMPLSTASGDLSYLADQRQVKTVQRGEISYAPLSSFRSETPSAAASAGSGEATAAPTGGMWKALEKGVLGKLGIDPGTSEAPTIMPEEGDEADEQKDDGWDDDDDWGDEDDGWDNAEDEDDESNADDDNGGSDEGEEDDGWDDEDD